MALPDAQHPGHTSMEGGPIRRHSASRQHSQDLVNPALEKIDPSTKFLFTPHTVTGLLLGDAFSDLPAYSAASTFTTLWRGLAVPSNRSVIAGVLVLVYYSRALDPPGKTVDPLQAHQAAYYNIKHGITAVCLVFLGE